MEGTPVSILEAMCMGKAVVSTEHAGIPYVIEHGIDGQLASERSNDELKTCIEELIVNPEIRDKMGIKAIEKVKKNHTVSIMQKRIATVFETL